MRGMGWRAERARRLAIRKGRPEEDKDRPIPADPAYLEKLRREAESIALAEYAMELVGRTGCSIADAVASWRAQQQGDRDGLA